MTVRRSAVLKNGALEISDSFIKDKRFGNDMSVEYSFMLGADCAVSHKDDRTLEIRSGDVTVTAYTELGTWIVEDGFYAPMYGAIDDTKRLRIRFDKFIEANEVRFSW